MINIFLLSLLHCLWCEHLFLKRDNIKALRHDMWLEGSTEKNNFIMIYASHIFPLGNKPVFMITCFYLNIELWPFSFLIQRVISFRSNSIDIWSIPLGSLLNTNKRELYPTISQLVNQHQNIKKTIFINKINFLSLQKGKR